VRGSVRRSVLGPLVAVGALTLGLGWTAELVIFGSPAAKVKPASVNEDTDTNDGGTPNNVVDDGDNAHPSGNDRSVENGGSGNQGNSGSDPDDDGNGPDRSNGGSDKPDGPGGVDLADQDGNNGCGNDDDFEDDNEGNCGGRRPTYPAPNAPNLGASDQ
jgi:hypothetical protein